MATRDLDLHVRQLVVGALLFESTPQLVVASCSTDADAAPLHVAGCVAGLRLLALALLALALALLALAPPFVASCSRDADTALTALGLLTLVLRATAACSWTELP